MSRKPALKRETLTELDLAKVVGAEWSSNPACIASIGPCVTFMCTANVACIKIGG